MKSNFLAFLIFFTLIFTLTFTTNLLASEKDIYEFSWLDPDKEVFVLQNRKFRKANNFHLNLGGGITTSGAFVDATTLQGRIGYFFTEDYGFEIVYAKNSGKDNETSKGVSATVPGATTGFTPFRRITESYIGGLFLWSPFYSKINTFNSIVYMDWIFGLGYAQLKEKNNKLRFTQGQTAQGIETPESHTGIIWQTGLKFYIDESFSIRTDLTAVHYSAANIATAGKSYKSNFDASAALGYSF